VLPVLTPAQSAEWDRRAVAAGIDLASLMHTAGRAVAQVVVARYPHALAGGVLVLCGPGNNGGDGWVAARTLHRLGVRVRVASPAGEASPLAAQMARLARDEGVPEVAADGPWPGTGLVVDALLGTGATGAPRPPMAALLQRAADLQVPVVAVDGPTGVDLASGLVHEDAGADVTVTFGGLRRGHLLAREECGDVVVADIGHPPAAAEWPRLVGDREAAAWLPALHARDHKGDRGRVVVVGGDAGMQGAARMAGRAAFAAGAGLVHVVAPAESVATIAAFEPDLQTLAHPLEGPLDAALADLLGRADAVIVGPGLGRREGRAAFVHAVLAHARAAVVDADAIVALAGDADAVRRHAARGTLVFTPHPGEFRALAPDLAAEREVDPWGAAEAACARLGATVLLKGVPTVVAHPGRAALTVGAGNPGLATGGSGDVLGGFIGAALARGTDPLHAAAAGAQLLGRAADTGARRHTARALRPADVVAAVADVAREWARTGGRWPLPVPFLLELPRPVTV